MINTIRSLQKRIYDFFAKSMYFSLKFAIYDIIWWLCFYFHPSFSWKLSTYAINKKTEWLDRYIEDHYSDIIGKYVNDERKIEKVLKYNIWVFWGQGESAMPTLVRACYHHLVQYNDNVVLVTNENLNHYIKLPEVIYQKVRDGRLAWAHFSDIVRTTLLAEYGGLWLDATVWVSGKIPFHELDEYPMFSASGTTPVSNRSVRFWSSFDWNWSTWCMFSTVTRYRLFEFVSNMLQEIAIKENFWPDYVIQDYLINYSCRKLPQISLDMERSSQIKCRNRNRLAELMNEPFDETIYQGLISSDFVFKLSFRTKWKGMSKQGIPTFYGKLILGY